MGSPWANFTQEDWKNARYCEECGLPLLKDEESRKLFCVYCTWVEDGTVINRQVIAGLEKDFADEYNRLEKIIAAQTKTIDILKRQIGWQSTLHDTPLPGIRYEVWQHDLLTFDVYNEIGYWESGITPQYFREVGRP